jgi:hypothetical protein
MKMRTLFVVCCFLSIGSLALAGGKVFQGKNGEKVTITMTKLQGLKEATVQISGTMSAMEGQTFKVEIYELGNGKDFKTRWKKSEYNLIADRNGTMTLFLPENDIGIELKYNEKLTQSESKK